MSIKDKLIQLNNELLELNKDKTFCKEVELQAKLDEIYEINPAILAQVFRKYKDENEQVDFVKAIKLINMLFKTGYIYQSSSEGFSLPSIAFNSVKSRDGDYKQEIKNLYGVDDI